jgi:hypothetical protein
MKIKYLDTSIAVTLLLVSQLVMVFSWQGASASSCSMSASPPSLSSTYTPPLSGAIAGDQLVIATTITNGCIEHDQPFVAIVEVRNSDGLTEGLSWQSGTLDGRDGQVAVGVMWIPSHGDNFELRAFVVSDLENPQILSPIATSNVTIAANPLDEDNEVYVSSSIGLSNLGVRDSVGKNFAMVPTGYPILISVDTTNLSYSHYEGLLAVEVRNAMGETVHLVQTEAEFSTGTEIGVQWFPSETGHYQLRAFAISNLDDPRILTQVITSELDVGDDWLQQ